MPIDVFSVSCQLPSVRAALTWLSRRSNAQLVSHGGAPIYEVILSAYCTLLQPNPSVAAFPWQTPTPSLTLVQKSVDHGWMLSSSMYAAATDVFVRSPNPHRHTANPTENYALPVQLPSRRGPCLWHSSRPCFPLALLCPGLPDRIDNLQSTVWSALYMTMHRSLTAPLACWTMLPISLTPLTFLELHPSWCWIHRIAIPGNQQWVFTQAEPFLASRYNRKLPTYPTILLIRPPPLSILRPRPLPLLAPPSTTDRATVELLLLVAKTLLTSGQSARPIVWKIYMSMDLVSRTWSRCRQRRLAAEAAPVHRPQAFLSFPRKQRNRKTHIDHGTTIQYQRVTRIGRRPFQGQSRFSRSWRMRRRKVLGKTPQLRLWNHSSLRVRLIVSLDSSALSLLS